MALFHPKILERFLHTLTPPDTHIEIIRHWTQQLEQGALNRETSHDSEFIQRILVDILGYQGSGTTENWTLAKNQPIGRGNVDVALGYFNTKGETRIIAPFELKGAKTRDLDALMAGRNKSPIAQAWEYAIDAKGAQWVLISNYREIRLYAFGYGRKDYECFDLPTLQEPKQYTRFVTLLCAENLLNGRTLALLKESERHDKEITFKLYQDYKQLRTQLIDGLVKDNPHIVALDAVHYSQTILDRILFVAFAEDKGLLPKETLKECYETANKWNPQPIWENFKGLFRAVDKGSPSQKIPGYNVGLFKDDSCLNELYLSNALCEGFKKIGDYDFASDVSVNILGHIFEQSITDLEEIKARLLGSEGEFDKKKSKRKKDGIFYTPAYITRYIVEQAVGGWLGDRKKAFGFDALPELNDEDYASIKFVKGVRRTNSQVDKHIRAWEAYKQALCMIKVLDPACGSGAFLNEVFDYLYREGQTVNREITKLNGGQTELFRWEVHILANNLYGVDINQESVEITKLSLWLKTANPCEKLTYLDANIKCGNSLIDDSQVAGDLAFKWEDEFSEVMQAGGFDVIVGNPPYVFARNQGFTAQEKHYFYNGYSQAHYQLNTYVLFVEKSYQLLQTYGYNGFILPNTWLTINSFKEFRKFILENLSNITIINLLERVFDDADVDCCILIFCKHAKSGPFQVGVITQNELQNVKLIESSSIANNEYVINFKTNDTNLKLLDKISQNSMELKSLAFIAAGLQVYEIGKGIPIQSESDKKNRIYHSIKQLNETYVPYLEGKDVKRYVLGWSNEYLSYGSWLAAPRKRVDFKAPRILVRQIPSLPPYSIEAVMVEHYCLNDRNSMVIHSDKQTLLFCLAVLNSRLTTWWFVYTFDKFQRKTFPQFKVNELERFPIPRADESKKNVVIHCTEIMLAKNKELQAVSNQFLSLLKMECGLEKLSIKLECWYLLSFVEFLAELDKKKISLSLIKKSEWLVFFEKEKAKALDLQRLLDTTDREIDQLVYQLYELTNEEIAQIEA